MLDSVKVASGGVGPGLAPGEAWGGQWQGEEKIFKSGKYSTDSGLYLSYVSVPCNNSSSEVLRAITRSFDY